jgi:hypothetical protein
MRLDLDLKFSSPKFLWNSPIHIKGLFDGVLFGFGSSSSREVVPNVLLEEPFFSKKQRIQRSPSGGAVPNHP